MLADATPAQFLLILRVWQPRLDLTDRQLRVRAKVGPHSRRRQCGRELEEGYITLLARGPADGSVDNRSGKGRRRVRVVCGPPSGSCPSSILYNSDSVTK
ncbi:hypothetical protein MTO96_029164 [Rhipicephalus appendiculatus]